ncbi:hypothetical protein [Marinicella meishanensis]|uniref:hypothetical protein n=1 Tax=Marinicella meishanensis TaxID=2873263 RepID=UPI001CBC472B|nr:hypothetical protein [Marinicella sp. NBU2979]
MKTMILVMMLGMFSLAQARHLNVKFDDHGKMINPDDYLVYTALEADKRGHKNDAMWRLIDAAEYGNKHAQYFIGLLHLQKDDQITGLAWLRLAGKGISNNDHLMATLPQQLNAQQLTQVDQLLAELKQTYNFENAIAKRAEWKKSQSFGGSRIKGHIPMHWKAELPNGKVVFANEVKRRMESFIFEYRYDEGEVILKDLETADPEPET